MESKHTNKFDDKTMFFKKLPDFNPLYKGTFKNESEYQEYVDWKSSKELIYFIDRNYKIIWAKKEEKSHEKIAKRILENNPELNRIFQKSGEKIPEIFLIMYGYMHCTMDRKKKIVNIMFSGVSNDDEFIHNLIRGHEHLKNDQYSIQTTDLAREVMSEEDYKKGKDSYLHKGIDASVCEIIGYLDWHKSVGIEP